MIICGNNEPGIIYNQVMQTAFTFPCKMTVTTNFAKQINSRITSRIQAAESVNYKDQIYLRTSEAVHLIKSSALNDQLHLRTSERITAQTSSNISKQLRLRSNPAFGFIQGKF